jgi:hypothetical protein
MEPPFCLRSSSTWQTGEKKEESWMNEKVLLMMMAMMVEMVMEMVMKQTSHQPRTL